MIHLHNFKKTAIPERFLDYAQAVWCMGWNRANRFPFIYNSESNSLSYYNTNFKQPHPINPLRDDDTIDAYIREHRGCTKEHKSYPIETR